MYTSAVFAKGSISLHFSFTWTASAINCSGHKKTRDTGLPDGEDHIPLHSLVLTQYRCVTDGRTDGLAVADTALAKLCFVERCKKALQPFCSFIRFCFVCVLTASL